MIAVPLVLALLGADRASARALVWEQMAVDWIASTGTVHDLEDVLPRRQALLVRALGCEHSGCRELARDELVRQGEAAWTAIAWGLRSRDPEVRSACRKLAARLFACSRCAGTGEVDEETGTLAKRPHSRTRYWITCPDCKGTGDLRYRTRRVKVGDDFETILIPVDFFAGD